MNASTTWPLRRRDLLLGAAGTLATPLLSLAATRDDGAAARALAERYFDQLCELDPFWASTLGLATPQQAARIPMSIVPAERARADAMRRRMLASLQAVADERAAVHGGEDHVLPADVNRPLRVPRLNVELGRRLRDLLDHEVGIEFHELTVHVLARRSERLDRVVVEELDPELAHDPPPAAVEGRHRVLGEDLVARHAVYEHSSRSSACSSPPSPVSRTSSGRPRTAAACSAFSRSASVGSCASQTTRV